MYDSDSPDAIPGGVAAAGYINGYAADAWAKRGYPRFPDAKRISVFLADEGDVCDVETGDLLPWQAPEYVQMALARGVADPWVYVSLSNWNATKTEFDLRGMPQPSYWVADYDGVAEIPAGAIAKQYANPAIIPDQPHYDLSVVADGVFGGGGGELLGGSYGSQSSEDAQVIIPHPTVQDRVDMFVVGRDGNISWTWGTTDQQRSGVGGGGEPLGLPPEGSVWRAGSVSVAWYRSSAASSITKTQTWRQAVTAVRDSDGSVFIRETDYDGAVVKDWTLCHVPTGAGPAPLQASNLTVAPTGHKHPLTINSLTGDAVAD